MVTGDGRRSRPRRASRAPSLSSRFPGTKLSPRPAKPENSAIVVRQTAVSPTPAPSLLHDFFFPFPERAQAFFGKGDPDPAQGARSNAVAAKQQSRKASSRRLKTLMHLFLASGRASSARPLSNWVDAVRVQSGFLELSLLFDDVYYEDERCLLGRLIE